jgi:hypothetical protein
VVFVILLRVCIHTGQAKFCLTTVGIEPATFGILGSPLYNFRSSRAMCSS